MIDYYNGIWTPSEEVAREIINSTLKENRDNYGKSIAFYLSGLLYRRSGDPVKAAVDYHRCLESLSRLDTTDYFLEISVRKNLGSIYDDFGAFQKAINIYEAAIPYAEKFSLRELASLYSNMGNSYRDMKDGEKLIESYFKSLEYSREINDHFKTAQIFNKLGLSFFHANLIDTAEAFFYQAIFQRDKLSGNELRIIGQAYHNLGQLQFQSGKIQESIESYNKALTFKSDKDRYITLMDLGEVLLL